MTTPLPLPLSATSAQGEDRSDFQAVRSWGTNSFAFMKATEGLSVIDPDFSANWANAKAEGKIRGAYCFVHPSDSAEGQAALFLETVAAQGLEDGDLLALDIEILTGSDGLPAYGSLYAAQRSVLKLDTAPMAVTASNSVGLDMYDAIRSTFPYNPPVIYTTESVGHTLTSLSHAPLWIAYPSTVAPTAISPWSKWTFWQWAFGGGQGGGDQDAFNGDYAELKAWIKTYLPDPPPPPSTQPGHVAASAKYTNATISWSGMEGKHQTAFEVYLAKPDHTTIEKASLPATARNYIFRELKEKTEYALGVLAFPTDGASAHYVTVTTE